MASQKLLVFDINDEKFSVDITNVDSIHEAMEVYKVPNQPECIEGLINLRGKIYTVFNLRKKFGLPAKELDENAKIIIINYENMKVGFIVDQVNEIATIDSGNVEPVPDPIDKAHHRYMSGVAKREKDILLILDLAKILSMEEEKVAASMTQQ